MSTTVQATIRVAHGQSIVLYTDGTNVHQTNELTNPSQNPKDIKGILNIMTKLGVSHDKIRPYRSIDGLS